MQIDIQRTGFTLTDGILMKRLADDLGRGDDHVTRAIARLSAINGPRGASISAVLSRCVCGNVSPWNYDAKIE